MGVEAWQAGIDDLEVAWGEIAASSSEVPGWVAAIAELRIRHLELVQDGHWRSGPADFLSVLGQRHRETYHSSAIAWLARPEGHHGLGDRFLRNLLAECGSTAVDLLDDQPNSPVHVRTEVTMGDCRADIIVTTALGRLLIENKTGAPESPNQLQTYHDLFDDGVTRFAFLSPKGRAPVSAGDTIDAWMCISYAQVRDALRSSIGANDSPEGRAADVARSYLAGLEVAFP